MSESRWLQVNVALSQQKGSGLPSARTVFAVLSERLPEWRRQRAVNCFFFMRKPPGLRLRFQGLEPTMTVLPKLRRDLRTLRACNGIERFFCSVYEPEADLFGGVKAMRLVHHHFDADSMAWIALDRLAQSGKRGLVSETTITTALLNDLFWRTVLDRSELWDIWRNLTKMVSMPVLGNDTRESATRLSIEALTIKAPWPSAAPEEIDICKQYIHANERLSHGLRRLWDQGRLNTGLRAVLAFVALFHMNRYGYGPSRAGALAFAMSDAWDPRAELWGGRDRLRADCTSTD